jgi:NADH-quinone oxidoreductase subunit C
MTAVDLQAHFERRREHTRSAVERRQEREKAAAVDAARWLGADLVDGPIEFRNQYTVASKLTRVHALLRHLRDAKGFSFFVDQTALDTLTHDGNHPERFAVVWTLLNLEQETQLRVMAYVDEDDPICPTTSDIWPAANWPEREIWDMYGIQFTGHPNLIRLLCPEEFSGFPLRKDYPLRGRGERDNFPVIKRDNEADA